VPAEALRSGGGPIAAAFLGTDVSRSQGLELIPSENFVSASVLEAVGSVMVRRLLRRAAAALVRQPAWETG